MWGIITVMTCDAERRLPWASTIFHQATEDLLTFLTFFPGSFSWFSTNCQVTVAETDSSGSVASTRITWLSRGIISEFFATVMAVCRLSPRWQRKLVCLMYKPLSNQNWAPPPLNVYTTLLVFFWGIYHFLPYFITIYLLLCPSCLPLVAEHYVCISHLIASCAEHCIFSK